MTDELSPAATAVAPRRATVRLLLSHPAHAIALGFGLRQITHMAGMQNIKTTVGKHNALTILFGKFNMLQRFVKRRQVNIALREQM